MKEAGLEEVEEYATKINNMPAQNIATRKIMDLCEDMVWRPGTWVSKMWW